MPSTTFEDEAPASPQPPSPSSRAPNGGAQYRLSSLRISRTLKDALGRCRARIATVSGLPPDAVTEASVLRLALEIGFDRIERGDTAKVAPDTEE